MNAKKPIAIILAAVFAALTFSACVSPNTPNTPDPAKQPTAEPTQEPTAEQTEDPLPYDRKEYDALLAFFELKDENGVSNGEKCFEDDYDPGKIDFWGGAEAWGDPCLKWNKNGNLEKLYLIGNESDPKELTGKLALDGFAQLSGLWSSFLTFESVSITNCPNFRNGIIESTGEIGLSGCWLGQVQLVSFAHCRFEGRDTLNHQLLADLTAEGSGSVELNCYADEDYYPVYIIAKADEGHSFLGWYDSDGNQVSGESSMEISDADIAGCEGEFIYTARFE